LPAALATLTPQAVREASVAVQLQVADLYSNVLAPIFIGLAIVYGLGVVAALLLPDGRLSDEFEQHTRDAAEAAIA
jgi:Ni/Fe-hydrogenase subunit HybB-like protein